MQNREPLVQALLKYPNPQDNPAKAVPLRAEALKQFNNLSPLNQLRLVGTQRHALVAYSKKKDPVTARAIARTHWQKHPQNHDAAHGILSLYMGGSDEDKTEAKKIVQQALRMPPAKGRINYSFQRDLMQVAERLQDANLANQIYQWAIKGDLSSIYADYTGDVLWKLNQNMKIVLL